MLCSCTERARWQKRAQCNRRKNARFDCAANCSGESLVCLVRSAPSHGIPTTFANETIAGRMHKQIVQYAFWCGERLWTLCYATGAPLALRRCEWMGREEEIARGKGRGRRLWELDGWVVCFDGGAPLSANRSISITLLFAFGIDNVRWMTYRSFAVLPFCFVFRSQQKPLNNHVRADEFRIGSKHACWLILF